MSKDIRPFLDFYGRHSISPVAQDISDLKKHFRRRNALYQHCGIPSAWIEQKDVLEIGPGTGHNALFTNSLKPRLYTLVDGNPKSCTTTQSLLNDFFKDTSNCEIIEKDIQSLSLKKQYDFVISEGILPTQKNPDLLLKTIGEYVKPGGMLIITCMDSISFLSDNLRKVAALLILDDREYSISAKIEKLSPFFHNHIKHLPGMTRSIQDYLYDPILMPLIGRMFPIDEAIETLSNQFEVNGSSPNFIVDWRWYKDITIKNNIHNKNAISHYRKNIHNLLDYRYNFDETSEAIGQEMLKCGNMIFEKSVRLQKGLDRLDIQEMNNTILELNSIMANFSTSTASGLSEFCQGVDRYLSGKPFPSSLPNFEAWWGRGTQYLSFIKNNEDWG